ncbi:MAG: hypothetical protein K2X80_05415 [Pseudomonadaceae bacterium]|nr:hypothetical protein [Pseudomonadaceae bacterium]
MAFPDNALSSAPQVSGFAGSRALATTKTVDYEDGGIGIQDTSKGLLYQRWRARLIDGHTVLLDAPNVPAFALYEGAGITEISFSFDSNMRPVLAFVQAGAAKLRWFDSVVGEQVITEIGAGALTPRVSLDDKRIVGSDGYQISDVILGYVRDGSLYYRQQRDRFTVERLLATGITKGLIKIGFSRGLRLQFMLEI